MTEPPSPSPKRVLADDWDPSRGWDAVASAFIAHRSLTTGVGVVSAWAARRPSGGTVLDVGCGFGEPNGRALLDAGLEVFGVDASPRLVDECRRRCPGMTVRCAAVEDDDLFGRRFDGIVAVGLVFLLDEAVQRRLLSKAAAALAREGSFLFSAPWQTCCWEDALTGQPSRSLGRRAYVEHLAPCGLDLSGEVTDEGGNHYFEFARRSA